MKSHSNILNFYVIVKDEEDFINGTGDRHQLEAKRSKLKLHRHFSASQLSTDARSRENETVFRKKVVSSSFSLQKVCVGGFMFITVEYVLEMMKSTVILDPEEYIIRPWLLINPMKSNDMRPLLMDQIDDNKSISNTSAIVALKRYRNDIVKHYKTPADDRLLFWFSEVLVTKNDFGGIFSSLLRVRFQLLNKVFHGDSFKNIYFSKKAVLQPL